MQGRVHHNNFNLVRLLAATQVLLVHGINHFEYNVWFVDGVKAVPGVPAFFFTSGFLIYFAYERMHSRDRPGFFINRLLRIYPALLVCVLVSILTVYWTGYFNGRQIGVTRFLAWVASQTTIFQFYNPPFMREYGVGVLNGALWTISVEMQFYFLVPVLYFLLKNRPRLLATVFAVSLVVNVVANLALIRQPAIWDHMAMKLLMVSFVPHLYMFLFGFWLASDTPLREYLQKTHLIYLLLAYVLSMNFIGSYAANASNSINPVSFVLLACIVLKVSALRLPIPGRLQSFLETTDFSYGLYLYHMPLLNLLLVLALFSPLANIGLLTGITLLAAIASWYLIERPALSHKR
jgi:peptidoglycan/LPS O-acetylase OafA/YrhL